MILGRFKTHIWHHLLPHQVLVRVSGFGPPEHRLNRVISNAQKCWTCYALCDTLLTKPRLGESVREAGRVQQRVLRFLGA